MERRLVIVLVAIVGLLLGTHGFAQEMKKPETGEAEGGRINAFMVDKIVGSKVINLKGETLGKVENLVVDIDTGRILYAVLDSDGFLGIGGKLLPVPWDSLAAIPSEGVFFLNRSKEQMEKAPAFDKANLPDMGNIHWGVAVLKYYGAPAGYIETPPGISYGYGTDYGYGYYYPAPPAAGVNLPAGAEDPYKKLFDPKTIKTISGEVIKIDQVPEFGFGLQMRLTVFVDKKEILPVYLGPVYYVLNPRQPRYLKLGDRVTVKGSEVALKDEPIMIAMTVERGNEVLRLRDQEGLPAWIGWKKIHN